MPAKLSELMYSNIGALEVDGGCGCCCAYVEEGDGVLRPLALPMMNARSLASVVVAAGSHLEPRLWRPP